MKYKLIVSDMDGTLLGDNHKITEENKIALSKALEKGVKIVPASGRIYNSAREHFDFLDINTPLIACNGAIIKETKTNKLIYKNNIPNDICLKIIDIFEKNEVYYQLYSENTMMCKNLSKEDQRQTKERLKKEDQEAFKRGIIIDQKIQCLPAKLEIIDDFHGYVTIEEGKYHQIKKMFLSLKNEVVSLKRISFDEILLDENLSEGMSRPLNKEERNKLIKKAAQY